MFPARYIFKMYQFPKILNKIFLEPKIVWQDLRCCIQLNNSLQSLRYAILACNSFFNDSYVCLFFPFFFPQWDLVAVQLSKLRQKYKQV